MLLETPAIITLPRLDCLTCNLQINPHKTAMSHYIRREAVEALTNTNDSRVIAPLTRVALNDKDNYTQKMAKEALSNLKVWSSTMSSVPPISANPSN